MAKKGKSKGKPANHSKPSGGVGIFRRGGPPSRSASKPAAKPNPKGKPAASSSSTQKRPPAGSPAARLAALARLAKEESATDVENVGMAAGAGSVSTAGKTVQFEEDGVVVKKSSSGLKLPTEKGDAEANGGGPAMVMGGAKTVQRMDMDDGVQVVAKGASKFTLADMQALKRIINVKGGGSIVDGINLDTLRYDTENCVPVVAQDRITGAVLTLGWMNKEALDQSLRTKVMAYWNKSTNKLQVKGEETGSSQKLVKMLVDCDNDTMLAIVEQDGAACHRDTSTCWSDGKAPFVATYLGELDRIMGHLARRPPKGTEFAGLIGDPVKALKKIVEDTKLLVDSLRGARKSLDADAAELLYHILVGLRARGVSADKVLAQLRSRTEELQKA